MRDGVEVEQPKPEMAFTVTYKYSVLDKEPQFGIVSSLTPHHETYVRWVWFYLGAHFGENKPRLYPFELNDATNAKTYKYCNDAKRQAKLIINHINKVKS